MSEFLKQNSNQPKSYDQDVANILKSSMHAAGAIEERFAQKAKNGQPLYVFLGEHHSMSAHLLTEIRIMQLLKEGGYKIACGHEYPYNFLSMCWSIIEPYEPAETRKKMMEIIETTPSDDPIRLKALSCFINMAHAAVTTHLRTQFILRNSISSVFNDAARTGVVHSVNDCLDQRDAFTRKAFINAGYAARLESSSKVSLESVAGMNIRNHFMIAQMQAHAAECQSDIYIQFCGASHIAGNGGQYTYCDSLLDVAAKQGMQALGIPFYRHSLSDKVLEKGGVVQGCDFQSGCFNSDDDEIRWLDAVLPHVFAGEGCGVNFADFNRQCGQEVKAFLNAWVCLYSTSARSELRIS